MLGSCTGLVRIFPGFSTKYIDLVCARPPVPPPNAVHRHRHRDQLTSSLQSNNLDGCYLVFTRENSICFHNFLARRVAIGFALTITNSGQSGKQNISIATFQKMGFLFLYFGPLILLFFHNFFLKI